MNSQLQNVDVFLKYYNLDNENIYNLYHSWKTIVLLNIICNESVNSFSTSSAPAADSYFKIRINTYVYTAPVNQIDFKKYVFDIAEAKVPFPRWVIHQL